MIQNSTIERILETVPIEEVIGGYLALKRRGANMIGLCPFHNEKTPSFSVSPVKGIYHCFGCGKGGNLINFVMEYEHMSFTDAVKFVAQKYHIPIEEDLGPKEGEEQKQKRESLLAACAFAARTFQEQLFTERGRISGLSYFEERGLRKETIDAFQLGYAPDTWDFFVQEAGRNQFDEEILLEAGLIKQKEQAREGERRVYDAYRDRVIFPIADLSGRVVGFGARRLKEDNSPKYVNSPENEIYKKSKILYGLNLARKAIREKDFCILTEGYMDVITLYQAGIENVVASSGTSLTEEQVRQIGRFTRNITVLYDGDAAGINAALRGIDLILQGGLQASVVILPEGHDPDTYCKEVGASGFEKYVEEHRQDFLVFKSKHLKKQAGTDPLKLSDAIKEVVADLLRIPDKIRASLYYATLSEILGVNEELLASEARNQRRNKLKDLSPEKKDLPQTPESSGEELQLNKFVDSDDFKVHKSLVRLMLRYGDLPQNDEGLNVRDFIIEELEADGLKLCDPRLQKILDVAHDDPFITSDDLIVQLQMDPELGPLVSDMLFDREILSENWAKYDIIIKTPEEQYRREVVQNLNEIKRRIIQQQFEMNMERLKDVTDEELMDVLLTQKDLEEKRNRIAAIMGTVIVK